MKFRGRIFSADIMVGRADDAVELVISGEGKEHTGGRDQPVVGMIKLEVPRALVKDFRLGDLFEVTLAKVES